MEAYSKVGHMIFVTVGTHEQQFNRLVECMDNLVKNGDISEDVIIQTGYSTYEPKHCRYSQFFKYQEMIKNVEEARIVITHGGPSSFIMPLQIGKTPIVVPRKKEYNEHVNNHQVDFCKAVEERMGTIIVVDNVEELKDVIQNYDVKVKSINCETGSNNTVFCQQFGKIVEELINE